jgi:hypothetical protein
MVTMLSKLSAPCPDFFSCFEKGLGSDLSPPLAERCPSPVGVAGTLGPNPFASAREHGRTRARAPHWRGPRRPPKLLPPLAAATQ